MVALLERDAELADAGISYRCRNLEYTLGRSREEFRARAIRCSRRYW